MCDKKEKRHRRETTTEKNTKRWKTFVFFQWKRIMRRKYKKNKTVMNVQTVIPNWNQAFYRWRQKKKMFEHTAGRRRSSWTGESVDPKQQNHNMDYSLQVRFRSDGRWWCRSTRGILNYDSGFIFTVFIAVLISSCLYFTVSLHLWIFFPTIFNFFTSTLNLQKALRRHLCLPLFERRSG